MDGTTKKTETFTCPRCKCAFSFRWAADQKVWCPNCGLVCTVLCVSGEDDGLTPLWLEPVEGHTILSYRDVVLHRARRFEQKLKTDGWYDKED